MAIQVPQLEIGILLPSDRQKIRELFQRSAPAYAIASRHLVEIIVEARLRIVPTQHRAMIKNILENAYIETPAAPWPRGRSFDKTSYDPSTRSISLYIPEKLQGGPVHYQALLHELEHAIQNILISHDEDSRNKFYARINNDAIFAVRYLYWSEEAAMRMEHLYLSLLPEDFRKQLSRELKDEADLDDFEKSFLTFILEKASLSADAYLETQREMSRYSWKSLTEKYSLDPNLPTYENQSFWNYWFNTH